VAAIRLLLVGRPRVFLEALASWLGAAPAVHLVGVVTEPSAFRMQPCSSPMRFRGASTSAAKRPPSVRIASTKSGVAFSKPGRFE